MADLTIPTTADPSAPVSTPNGATGSPPSPDVITSSSLTGTTPFKLTAPNPATGTDGALGAIQSSTDTFTQGLEADAKAKETKSADALKLMVDNALSSPGQAQLTDKAYSATVDPAQADLKDINNRIIAEQNSLNHELTALQTKNPNGLFGTGLAQEMQRIKDASLARQADLSVIQMAKQGKYDSAKAIADRAIAAKVEQNKNVTDALKLNYEDNKSLFTTAEQHAFETKLADRGKAQDLQVYAEKAYYDQLIHQNDPKYQADLETAKLTNDQTRYQLTQAGVPGYGASSTGASDPVSAASAAILGNESNGSYSSMSPVLTGGSYKGQRSYGKYQVLESNIPSWTKQYYGQSLTPQQFLASPAAQEAVQKGKIGDLWTKYGNIQDVASIYFTGVPYAQAVAENRRDQATGMSVQDYVAKAASHFNASSATAQPGTATNGGSGNTAVDNYAAGVRDGTVDISAVPKLLQQQVVAVLNSPTFVTPKQQSNSLSNYQLADNLLRDPNLDAIFGIGGKLNPANYIPGTHNQAIKAQVQQIKDVLSLDNRGKLKGQGAVSDFEGRMLANAASIVNGNLSAADARKALVQVRGAFANAAGRPAAVKITDPSTGKSQIVNATRDGINKALQDGANVEYADTAPPRPTPIDPLGIMGMIEPYVAPFKS